MTRDKGDSPRIVLLYVWLKRSSSVHTGTLTYKLELHSERNNHVFICLSLQVLMLASHSAIAEMEVYTFLCVLSTAAAIAEGTGAGLYMHNDVTFSEIVIAS